MTVWVGSSGSGSATSINGTSVNAGGSLAVGQVLRATGAAASEWGAVNLSDTDAVTGVLPAANCAGAAPGLAPVEPPAVGSLTLTDQGTSTITKTNRILACNWDGPASGFALRPAGVAVSGTSARMAIGFTQAGFGATTGVGTAVYLKNSSNEYAVYGIIMTNTSYVFQRGIWTDTVTRSGTNVDVTVPIGSMVIDPGLFRVSLYEDGDDAKCAWSIDGGDSWVTTGAAAGTLSGFFTAKTCTQAGFTPILYQDLEFQTAVFSFSLSDP